MNKKSSKPLAFRLALLVLAFVTQPQLRAETEEIFEKSFKVAPGGTLTVAVDFGSIEVTGSTSDEVSIHAWRKVTRSSKADEERFLADRPIKAEQSGISVSVQSKADRKFSFSWGERQRTEGRYVIAVPSKYQVDLDTAGGGVAVRELDGSTKARTSGGGLDFEKLNGPLFGSTSGGGIRVKDCAGAPLNIHTSGGGIDVAGGKGELEGHSSGGGITVRRFDGPIRVDTSGGGIRAEDIHGKLTARTSGGPIDASFRGTLMEEVRLETSGGGVRVKIPAAASFDLDAATSAGSVHTDFPVTVTGKIDRGHIHGPVNGGGMPVVLRTSGGGIQVEKL